MLEFLFIVLAYLIGFHMGEKYGEEQSRERASMTAQILYAKKLEHLHQLLNIDTKEGDSLASQLDDLEFDK